MKSQISAASILLVLVTNLLCSSDAHAQVIRGVENSPRPQKRRPAAIPKKPPQSDALPVTAVNPANNVGTAPANKDTVYKSSSASDLREKRYVTLDFNGKSAFRCVKLPSEPCTVAD